VTKRLVKDIERAATEGTEDGAQWERFARDVCLASDRLSCNEAVMVLCAFAKADRRDAAVFFALAPVIVQQIDTLTPEHISMALNAFARVIIMNTYLLQTVASRLSKEFLCSFSPRATAIIMNAYAKFGYKDARLWELLIWRATGCIRRSDGRDLVAMTCALARVSLAPPSFLVPAVNRLTLLMPSLAPHSIALLTGALDKMTEIGADRQVAKVIRRFRSRLSEHITRAAADENGADAEA